MRICRVFRGVMAFALISASSFPGTSAPAGAAHRIPGHPAIPERRVDMTFRSDPLVTLAGTLSLPVSTEGGPVPVVLILPGHGPWEGGGFPDLVARLARLGIASFEYDKRGIGQSLGSFDDRMEPITRDAAAAVAFLRTRPEIDPRRIAVLGMSQGGAVAPALAAADGDIAAVVTLAGPAGKRGAMFLDSMREVLRRGGMEAAAAQRVAVAAAPLMTAMSQHAAPASLVPLKGAVAGALVEAGWNREQADGALATLADPVVVSQFGVGTSEALSALRVGVLAVYAAEDDIVLGTIAQPAARAALAGNPDATVIELPAVNHVFQQRSVDLAGRHSFSGPSVSDAMTLDVVSGWLARRLAPVSAMARD
ncbi:alpha/beta hydrolase family protein [Sphingomonas japonica]|uniref:Serine aminopeptidase S33 domain-containing protein n=1 Tax=Sphingomonas japonica TaxID=511662 RepID=A0ABX0U454_9SPHN|nr:alpha/beta fold hydrolase [Sphingomonas japonica]NIJ24161.1 hypothetical protein [Sphingomonas japonica]